MSKPIYRVSYDHVLLNGRNSYAIDLDSLVIGVHIRVYATSPEGLLYGLNQDPTIPLSATDLPASYGGYHVNDVPAIISDKGNLNIRWNNGNIGQGVVIIARLMPEPMQDLEVCD